MTSKQLILPTGHLLTAPYLSCFLHSYILSLQGMMQIKYYTHNHVCALGPKTYVSNAQSFIVRIL